VRANRFEEIEAAVPGLAAELGEPARPGPALALTEARLGAVVEAIVERQPEIETGPARARARETLLA
jgi:hypothetical protein